MTTNNKYKVINWTLASLLIGLILTLFGILFADNRAMSKDISNLALKINTIESKPFISSKDDVDKIKTEITALNKKQIVIESKLDMIIDLSIETNRKIDRHMQNSIPKPNNTILSKNK